MPETDMKLSADAITELFAATDRGDVEAVTGFFRDDVEVFFGNNDPIRGRQAYAALSVYIDIGPVFPVAG